MVELQAGIGFGGAARQFYYNHRTLVLSVVLSVAGIGTGLAAASAGLQGIALADALLIAGGALCAAAMAFWQTRHMGLAAVTAFAPLPGLLWAAPLSGGGSFGAVPLQAYSLAFAAAALLSEARVARVLSDTRRELPRGAASAAMALMAIWAVLWFRKSGWSDAVLQATADSALALLSVFILLPLASDLLHFDEAFVARANRARERRVRVWEKISGVTIPRWAISFTGIALVFLALGWYGSEPAMRDGGAIKLAAVLLAIVVAGAFAGGWREGFAVALIGAVVSLIALWASVVDRGGGSVAILQITVFAAFLSLYGARRASAYLRQGDPPVIAQRRMVEGAGGQAFAGAGAVAAIIPALAVWPGSIALCVGMAAAVAMAIVFTPAAATALEVLLPRRRAVEQLYGKSGKHKKT